jgi:hypothetical protein
MDAWRLEPFIVFRAAGGGKAGSTGGRGTGRAVAAAMVGRVRIGAE